MEGLYKCLTNDVAVAFELERPACVCAFITCAVLSRRCCLSSKSWRQCWPCCTDQPGSGSQGWDSALCSFSSQHQTALSAKFSMKKTTSFTILTQQRRPPVHPSRQQRVPCWYTPMITSTQSHIPPLLPPDLPLTALKHYSFKGHDREVLQVAPSALLRLMCL